MMNKLTVAAFSLLAVIAGCNCNKAEDPEKTSPTNGDIKTTVNQDVSKGALEELKNDAFEYSGLSHEGSLTYTGKLNPNIPGDSGTQKSEWKENKDGESIFEITRTGILRGLGSETVKLTKDGVYIIGTNAGSLNKEALTLPSPFEIGTKWPTELQLDTGAMVISSTMTSEVVRKETIKVPAGEYECLVVESKTTLTTDQPGTSNGVMDSTTYYAKGLGVVKMVAKGKNPMGEAVDIMIELSSTG